MSETNEGLPEQLGEGLSPRVREALKHPCRRQILRSLDAGGTGLSASEIARDDSMPCSLSCTGYHLRVLESNGLVAGSSEDGGGATTYQFATAAGEQEVVRSLLAATAGDDRQHLAHATGC
jgi:predicted transcriptional regulator